jgi:hypothetical protein
MPLSTHKIQMELADYIVGRGLPRHSFSVWMVHELKENLYVVRIDPMLSAKQSLIPHKFKGAKIRVEDRAPAIAGWASPD